MSIRVGEGTRVTLAYRLQTNRGDVLEERTPENPFVFDYGQGQTLPAIENVILGKTEGFEASMGVAAKEAYGVFDDELVATVPLSTFPKPDEVQVGMKYSTQGPDGEEITVRVVEVDDENATVDGNHPLAGVDIEIDLKILAIESLEFEDALDAELISPMTSPFDSPKADSDEDEIPDDLVAELGINPDDESDIENGDDGEDGDGSGDPSQGSGRILH